MYICPGDQDGKSVFGRHVYGNPNRPEVCPVLALAVYVFMLNSFRSPSSADTASPLLFVKSGAEDRFSQWMHKFLRTYQAEIEQLFNTPVSDFGQLWLFISISFSFNLFDYYIVIVWF